MAQEERISSQGEKQVLEAEQLEAASRIKPDFVALDALWSDRLFINGTEDLIFTKAHLIGRLESGTLRYRSFERTPTKVAVHDFFAIVTGNESIVPQTGQDGGNMLLCSYMNVWTLEDGRWRLIGRHVHTINKSPADYL